MNAGLNKNEKWPKVSMFATNKEDLGMQGPDMDRSAVNQY